MTLVLGNGLARRPQTADADCGGNDNQQPIQSAHGNPRGGLAPVAPVHPQPQHAGDAIGKPTGEQRGDQAEQVAEDGDGLGNDEGNNPDAESDAQPADPARLGALDDVSGAGEDAAKDVLGRYVAVDDTCEDDGGDGDAPDDLADGDGTGSGKGGGRNGRADVVVDDDGGDDVQRGVADLEEHEGLGPVVGLLELGHDAEEARVAAEGDGDVGDGQKGRSEPDLAADVDAHAADGPLNADVDHGDQHRGEDGGERGEGIVAGGLEGAGGVERPEDEHAHDAPDDGAC